MGKKSFVLYYEDWDLIEELNTEQRGALLTAIYADQLGTELPDMDLATRIIFKSLRNQLHRDAAKYEQAIEKRREAGRKGAEARWNKKESIVNQSNSNGSMANDSKRISDMAKMAVSVSASDSVSVSVSDSVSETDSDVDQTDEMNFSLYGVMHNVRLTQAQRDDLKTTYQDSSRLIDKVSTWLPGAKRDPKDHFALVHKFAVNENWPKKPRPEPPPSVEENQNKKYVPAPAGIKKKLGRFEKQLEVL